MLALGCEDGSVRLLSTTYNTLTHLRRLDRVKSRILSIAWGPPIPRETTKNKSQDTEESESDDEEDDWMDSWLVTGCSDSSIRKWDITTGRVTDRMTTDRVRGERTLVWTVAVLGYGSLLWKIYTSLNKISDLGMGPLCRVILWASSSFGIPEPALSFIASKHMQQTCSA